MNQASLIVNTLASAAGYSLFALAVVLAYRSSRILLFCVGEIGILAAYVLLQVWTALAAPLGYVPGLIAGLLAATAVSAVVGLLLHLVLGRLDEKASPFVGTAVTIAFSVALLGVMTIAWQGEIARLPVPDRALSLAWLLPQPASVSALALGVALAGGLLCGLLLLAFYRSHYGIELQALASNRALAQLRGIPVRRRLAGVWIACAVISGWAGIFCAALAAVSTEGAAVGFSGIVAAIIGGLTSPGGALIGALLLATGENLTGLFFDARYSVVVPVLLLVLLLAVRPSGLSARVESILRT
ncbi:branched-chain amino acid ABC transporter permease [Achromobacter marplatensis]|uniref:branched-chain amino acid ABC transporter permease n=1 Tax=Achromobacter marplatensis TaxID=470868 RepID=UPI0028EA3D1A|nr:branched-chain amino acid ABC transporter permease [Achromobacter marplatensis]